MKTGQMETDEKETMVNVNNLNEHSSEYVMEIDPDTTKAMTIGGTRKLEMEFDSEFKIQLKTIQNCLFSTQHMVHTACFFYIRRVENGESRRQSLHGVIRCTDFKHVMQCVYIGSIVRETAKSARELNIRTAKSTIALPRLDILLRSRDVRTKKILIICYML